VKGPPREPHPIAEAMKWVGVVSTIGMEMVLPGLAGRWLDVRFGLHFLAISGFVLGFALGLWSLVRLTRQTDSESRDKK
jgi:hypothetical protein